MKHRALPWYQVALFWMAVGAFLTMLLVYWLVSSAPPYVEQERPPVVSVR